jgi:hypothetical protein
MKTCKLNVQGHVISTMQLPKNNNTCGCVSYVNCKPWNISNITITNFYTLLNLCKLILYSILK